MTEPYVRPDVRALLDFVNALPGQKVFEVPIEASRAMMHASRQAADAPTGELAVIRNFEAPGPAGPIPLRLFDAREERGPGPLMVFYHGGGWAIGNVDTHEPFCAEIARLMDLPVVSVDYRLAPEHPFPAGIEDAIAATRWLATSPESLGRQATGLVPFGDSAGGNFTIVVSQTLRDDPAAVPVLAQWPIYPATDPIGTYESRALFGEGYLLSGRSMDWFANAYAPDREDRRYNTMVAGQAGLPPTLILTASLDPLRDQGRAYAAACIQAGVDVAYVEAQGTVHGFICVRKACPSGNADIARCVALLKGMLGQS